jgi:hypothetical protein
LFTATPVRNDENKFLIDSRYVFTYSFQQAETDSYIRNVGFELFQSEENIDPVISFANKVFTRYQQYIEHYGCNINEVKVLIRCGGSEDIKSMVNALKDRISVVGIHERFTNRSEDNCLTNQVPEDIRTSDIVFWVHQFKLIEGIDNYQFSLLGIYETLPDPRALVQQIGRIIRQGEHPKEALVMMWEDEIHQKEWWHSYLEYERLTYLNPLEMLFKYEEYYESVKEAHPSTVYLDKKYLRRFSITQDEGLEGKLKKYQIPRKANIYETTRNNDDTEMNVNVLIQKIKEEFNESDILVLDDFHDQNKLLGGIVYSKYENSAILVNESFLEIKIGIIFFRILGNKLYLYDSNYFVPSPIKKYWKRVAASQLKKLFYEDSQFSSMTIQNGNITFNSFNRMIVNSQDVSRMVPDVTDKFNLCTTLIGNKQRQKGIPSLRRYVGFSNARISQDSNNISLALYIKWLEEVDNAINNPHHIDHAIFNRFAAVTDIPSTTTPVSILFHFDEKGTLMTDYGSLTELDQEFYKVKDGNFTLLWDGNSYNIQISFSLDTGLYNLQYIDNEQEPKLFFVDKKKNQLMDWINGEQSFQIIVEGNECRYFKGNFYKVGVPEDYSWLSNMLDENDLIFPTRSKIVTEKGKMNPTVNLTMWDANSLFFLVAQKGSNIRNDSQLKILLRNADYIVCTDLQTEIADFITISESTKTICFIHCKAGDSKLSASAFQEVCGQIIKNLDYVNSSSERIPSNITYWDSEWKHTKYKVIVGRKLYNPGNLLAEDIWKKLKNIQQDPDSKTYVIALMGDAFSQDRYVSEKRKRFRIQKPELIQIDYILNQTALAVERAQAKFLVAFNKL